VEAGLVLPPFLPPSLPPSLAFLHRHVLRIQTLQEAFVHVNPTFPFLFLLLLLLLHGELGE
jgi:hypothetical protein